MWVVSHYYSQGEENCMAFGESVYRWTEETYKYLREKQEILNLSLENERIQTPQVDKG